jgi:hypothetical protein
MRLPTPTSYPEPAYPEHAACQQPIYIGSIFLPGPEIQKEGTFEVVESRIEEIDF